MINDNYCYPNTNILVNNFHIQKKDDLEALERQITAVRIAEWEKREPERTGYNFQKLCTIHQHIFGDLYEWAGKPRTIDIAKDDSLFCRAGFIEGAAQDIFSRLKKENFLQNLPKNQYVDRLADYMADVNVLHPFREGNGRTQRTFFRELSAAAGYSLEFEKSNKERVIEADIAAMKGNTDLLKKVLHEIVLEKEKQLQQSRQLKSGKKKSITTKDKGLER